MAFASRWMTETEQYYERIEKEALAVVINSHKCENCTVFDSRFRGPNPSSVEQLSNTIPLIWLSPAELLFFQQIHMKLPRYQPADTI